MFNSYQKFIEHDKAFNITFATILATIIVVTIGWTLALAGFYNEKNTWVSILFLAVVPVIVFLSQYGRTDIKIAYYKTWRDKINGLKDRRKILLNFARKYRLENWRKKLNKIEVDGRWKFHADTIYMKSLADERDILINQIHEDCTRVLEQKNIDIITAKENIKNANITLKGANNSKQNSVELYNLANSPEEKYVQRCNMRQDDKNIHIAEIACSTAEHELMKRYEEKEAILDEYRDTISRVNKVYYNRYRNYAESSVKKINRINGLKYDIEDMPETDKSFRRIRKETI